MDFDSLFIVMFIAVAVMLLLTVAIPLMAYKRWRRKGLVWGCLSLPVIGIILFFVTIGIYATLTDISHKNAMAYVRYVEEERDCRFEERWFFSADGTCYYEYDRGSHDHAVEPCGNDTFGHELATTRVDSCYAVKTSDLIVYFNFNQRVVTPMYHGQKIEVVNVDWEKAAKFFRVEE